MDRTEWRVKSAYEMGLREGLEFGQGQIDGQATQIEELQRLNDIRAEKQSELEAQLAEAARLRAEIMELHSAIAGLEQQRADDKARLAELEAELEEQRSFHGECPGGCGYWKEAAKRREAERDEARARVEKLENALRHVGAALEAPREWW